MNLSCRSMFKLWALLSGGVLAQACSDTAPVAHESQAQPREKSEPLATLPSTVLFHKQGGLGNIPVPSCLEQPDFPPWDNFAVYQQRVEDIVRRTWQAKSALRFTFESTCPTSPTTKRVRVRHRGHSAPFSSGGSVKFLGQAGLLGGPQGADTMSMAFDWQLMFNSTLSRWEAPTGPGGDGRIRYLGAHEFGHAIGFQHDMNRPDNDDSACADVNTPANGSSVYFSGRDINSIMSYCNNQGNNEAVLTPSDVQGVRAAYGWHATSDYRNDNFSDLILFRPGSKGAWFVGSNDGSGTFTMAVWDLGFPASYQAGDVPLTADMDGDGRVELVYWRNGIFNIFNAAAAQTTAIPFGTAGDYPFTGDWDGDGNADVATYRPSVTTYSVRLSSNGATVPFFIPSPAGSGTVPIVGDFDGDGKSDIGVFRNGSWWYQFSTGPAFTRTFGIVGDVPVPADYDGDRKTDFAVWRPSNGTWYYLDRNGVQQATQWGVPEDKVVPGDYTGDGIADFAIWRPSIHAWSIKNGWNINMGQAGDIPVNVANR